MHLGKPQFWMQRMRRRSQHPSPANHQSSCSMASSPRVIPFKLPHCPAHVAVFTFKHRVVARMIMTTTTMILLDQHSALTITTGSMAPMDVRPTPPTMDGALNTVKYHKLSILPMKHVVSVAVGTDKTNHVCKWEIMPRCRGLGTLIFVSPYRLSRWK